MAVVAAVKYRQDPRKYLKSLQGALIPRIEITDHYQVEVNDPATPIVQIYAALPQLYAQHPEYPGAICKDIGAPQGDEDEVWTYDVAVKYDDDFDIEDKEEPDDDNPLNRPTLIQGGFNETDVPVYRDLDGNPIKNSAGDPYDPPPTRKGGGSRFTMTKNLPVLNYAFLRTWKNAINSDGWLVFPQYTVRIVNITFNRQVESKKDGTGSWVYWPHTFEFEAAEPDIGDGTWRLVLLDQGFRGKFGSVLRPIRNDDGSPVTQPALLNLEGAESSTPFYLDPKRVYREVPFAALGLP